MYTLSMVYIFRSILYVFPKSTHHRSNAEQIYHFNHLHISCVGLILFMFKRFFWDGTENGFKNSSCSTGWPGKHGRVFLSTLEKVTCPLFTCTPDKLFQCTRKTLQWLTGHPVHDYMVTQIFKSSSELTMLCNFIVFIISILLNPFFTLEMSRAIREHDKIKILHITDASDKIQNPFMSSKKEGDFFFFFLMSTNS